MNTRHDEMICVEAGLFMGVQQANKDSQKDKAGQRFPASNSHKKNTCLIIQAAFCLLHSLLTDNNLKRLYF